MNRRFSWHAALLVILMTGVFVLLLYHLSWLRFPLDRDEKHFWPTALAFSHSLLPDLASIRSYDELSTPLPFLVFGQIERISGHGLVLSRYLNVMLSAGIVLLIAFADGGPDRTSLASVLGLVLFPYFLGVSTRVYTDPIASFLVVFGLWFQLREKYFMAGVAWALGIAARQYVVAFPLAAVGYELAKRANNRSFWRTSWICPLAAAATILLWFAAFGGYAPAAAVKEQELAPTILHYFFFDHALYFLSCIGAYYCLLETILAPMLSWRDIVKRWRWNAALAAALANAFVAFPPLANPDLSTMGYLDIALRWIFGDALRLLVLYLFALWALIRFIEFPLTLAGWMLIANLLVMTKAHLAWDKYALPLICALWLMRAMEPRPAASAESAPEVEPICKSG